MRDPRVRQLRAWGRRTFGGDRVVLVDLEPVTPPPDPQVLLRRTTAEAVILQDQAESVLRRIRARENLGLIAPVAGPLVRRFFALREVLLGAATGGAYGRLREELVAILDHDAMTLSVAMDFLASEWRSPALARQVDTLSDLGAPARRLEEIYTQLSLGPGLTG